MLQFIWKFKKKLPLPKSVLVIYVKDSRTLKHIGPKTKSSIIR